jgi:hypothetical protein
MKNQFFPSIIVLLFFSFNVTAQDFSADAYIDFRQSVVGISETQLEDMYVRSSDIYLKGFENAISFGEINYLDSVILKLELTNDELGLLKQNMFFVTERLNHYNFGQAFHTIYNYDLPVFITTDAILHALHMSYDQILKNLERQIMSGNLEEFLKSLYDNFGTLQQKYGNSETTNVGLADADLFITIAYSLISDKLLEGHFADAQEIRDVWKAIQDEKLVEMPMFTFPERKRKLDFSQFKVRGHYVYTEQEQWQGLKSLEPYFKTMMWLGKMDFLLTPPPANPWEEPWTSEEIQRMHIGAFMVNELLQKSNKLELLQFNETVINYLVGESDNLTPNEYQAILNNEEISSAEQLAELDVFIQVKDALNNNPELGQKILSDFFFMNPQGDKPGDLPISYRVSGQRFIIDSYVLGNVVFDRLIHNGQKVMRMMPKPMDILFPLGNNDVLPLLEDEFKKYPYAEQLANLRYIIDEKPDEFWSGSLYNVWLNSIRELNPNAEKSKLPLFMKTAAWQQEKMNTQLASWSQLRHDNLLYAKQSYTGGTGCSFPYSYVEPYPEFYARLKQFAQNAGDFFSQLPTADQELNRIIQFFPRFEEVMVRLEILAEKQLNKTTFSTEENDWLKTMLFADGGSGIPPYSGWYTDLFYDKWDAAEGDFTVVDVHTQPTDEAGNVVGRVLHTGIGEVNLGVFVANSPFASNQLTAFVGPVMSYYEKITDNFYRMTDQDWEELVRDKNLPERPEWTNIYLAGEKGDALEKGAELPSKTYTGTTYIAISKAEVVAYPNPVTNHLTLSISTKEDVNGEIYVFNSLGTIIKQTGSKNFTSGLNTKQISFVGLPEGMYIVKVSMEGVGVSVIKVIKK